MDGKVLRVIHCFRVGSRQPISLILSHVCVSDISISTAHCLVSSLRIEKWNERETEGLMNENAYREWLLEHSHSKSEGRGLIMSLGPVHQITAMTQVRI